MKLTLFTALRRKRQERRNVEAELASIDRLNIATQMWMDASQDLDLDQVLTLTRFLMEARPEATAKMLHDHANEVSRTADKLERV